MRQDASDEFSKALQELGRIVRAMAGLEKGWLCSNCGCVNLESEEACRCCDPPTPERLRQEEDEFQTELEAAYEEEE